MRRIVLLVLYVISSSTITNAESCFADKKQAGASFKSAQSNLKQGNLEEAAADLARCLDANPTEERCRSMLEMVNAERADTLITYQLRLNTHDLPRRTALVDSAARLCPRQEQFRSLGDSLRGCLDSVRRRAQQYFASAEAAGRGFGKLPSDLEEYAPYVPFVSDARLTALSQFFARVEREAFADTGIAMSSMLPLHNLVDAFARIEVVHAEGLRYPRAEHLSMVAAHAIAESLSTVTPLYALRSADRAIEILPLVEREAPEGLTDSWSAPRLDCTPMERRMCLREGPWVIFHGRRTDVGCSPLSSSGRRSRES